MKITIDTKEDSHQEIRKIIKMLSSLIGEETFTNQGNIFEDSSPEVNTGQNMFRMFDSGNAQPENTPSVNIEEKKPVEKEPDVDLGIPDVQEYD